jgi:hypothetical protein
MLCTLFLALGYFQGPKLASASVDTSAVISQSGQQLRLFANQAVADVKNSQVVVTPNVAHTVTTAGAAIAVQFGARLKYATDYRVRVVDVTSPTRAQPSTIEYSFTTATPDMYYLDRGDPEDTVMRTSFGGAESTPVYSARHIQDFALLDGSLAVVTLSDNQSSALDLVSLADGAVERVALPKRVVVQKLDAASSGSTLGFTLTSTDESLDPLYSATLFFLQLTGPREPKPVLGLDGKAVRVLNWEFVPGNSTLIALSRDRSLFILDPAVPGSVIPLGQFTELGPASRDGKFVTVSDAYGSISLALANGRQKRLQPSPVSGGDPYLGLTEVLSGAKRVEKLVVIDPSGIRFTSMVAVDDGKNARTLYRTPNDTGSIETFSISPNGQYAAIEIVPDVTHNASDGYHYDARSTSITTVFVDIASGEVVKSVEGFALSW